MRNQPDKHIFERIDKLDTNLRISSEWAKRKYKGFNSRFFAGKLPNDIEFEMSGTTNAVGDASCIVSNKPSPGCIPVGDTFVSNLKIRLSGYFNDITETEAEEVLLHEMIHIWQYVTIPKPQWGANMHGASFTTKMNEINRMSGGKYNVSATNDSSLKARHADDLFRNKKEYDELGESRLMFIKDKNNESKVDVIRFKNESDMKQFEEQFVPMHGLDVTGTASPLDIDAYRYRFGVLKPNTEENRNGYYIMNKRDIDEAKRLGAIK